MSDWSGSVLVAQVRGVVLMGAAEPPAEPPALAGCGGIFPAGRAPARAEDGRASVAVLFVAVERHQVLV